MTGHLLSATLEALVALIAVWTLRRRSAALRHAILLDRRQPGVRRDLDAPDGAPDSGGARTRGTGSRRDNLAAAAAHAIVSVFWFHPLVWWIERRMLVERERACDDLVLLNGARPEDYAAGLLKVCRQALDFCGRSSRTSNCDANRWSKCCFSREP